jgi:two-component system, chemotaxis family, protein-glutamate methylesterase/glutaminase
MGEDGARGLLEMKEAGAFTIAEDESTAVVYGMPGVAARLGAVGALLPQELIAARLTQAVAEAPA